MEYTGNKKIKLAKLIIVIAMMVVILFGATYAYYTFFKKVSFQITIENTTFDFIKTNSTFKTNVVLDPSLLKEEEHSGPASFSGYIQNTVAKATLDLSSSNDMYSCGYEVWLTPTTQSFAGSLIKFTIVGFESMTPYDESGNLVSNAESPVEVFEYTLSDKTLNQEYKIYESRMQSSSRDIVFAYRLYNISVPQSEMGNYSARITLKSKDCKSDGAILVNQTNDNYEPITDDTNVWPKTGETKTYKLSDNVNDTFSVTSSDDSALAVSMGADNQTLTVSKIKPGAMYMEINNTLADTSVKVFFPADYTYFVHDTNPSALAKYNDSTYKYYSENDGNRFFETDSETKTYTFNNINYTFKDSYTYNDMPNERNRLSYALEHLSGLEHYFYYSESETYDLGYRYVGESPNNYVWFNNERWRIIGLVPVDDGRGFNNSYVKIVRDEPFGFYYESVNSGDVLDFLNMYYVKGERATCNNRFNLRDQCDSISYLNDEDSLKMIQPVLIYKSYINYNSIYSLTLKRVVEDEKENLDLLITTGLQDVSFLTFADFVYASNRDSLEYNSQNNVDINLFSLGLSDNWLTEDRICFMNYSETTNYLKHFCNGGYDTDFQNRIRPTVYLKENVFVAGGDGTYQNPYILDIKEHE